MGKYKIYQIGVILVLIAVIIFSIKSCSNNNALRKLNTEKEIAYVKSQMLLQEKDSVINKQGKIIESQTSIITQDKDAINKISSEIFQLKKKDEKNLQTIAYLKNTFSVRIDSFKVAYTDTFTISDTASLEFFKRNSISVPRTASVDDAHFKLNQTITKTGVVINSLEIPDTLHTRIVEDKKGIHFQSFHTNPYIISGKQSSVFYKPKKKKQTFVKVLFFVAGAASTYFIVK